MKRRHFMAGMGIGAISLANTSNVNSAAAYDTLINVPVNDDKDDGHSCSKSVRIIGVGGAGCHLLTAMRTGGVFGVNGLRGELIAVDLCPHTLWYVEAANKGMQHLAPFQVISIAGEFGSDRRVNAARAAALRHRESLTAAVTGVDVVILIAGLGSGTGSGVTPMLAGWSRAAGVQTIVVAVTPFEIGRLGEQSDYALTSLSRNADQVVHFSNQALGDELGDDATLKDVFATQERRIAAWVQGLNFGYIGA